MTEVQNLGALEQRAERALEKVQVGVTGGREFAEAMQDIRSSGAHEQAGYRYFGRYYRDKWEKKAERSASGMFTALDRLSALQEFESAVRSHPRGDEIGKLPRLHAAEVLEREVPDVYERVDAWAHHLDSGRRIAPDHSGLRESIGEHKAAGVIEQLEERNVQVPPYPEGPSDEEVAYRKLSDLAAVAKDVTPEAAARAVSSSTAYSVAPNYDFLLPWVRGFLAELHLRAGR